MGRLTPVLLFVLIFAAVAFSGIFKFNTASKSSQVPVASAACVDYDPPNTALAITFPCSGGDQYDLIKKEASIDGSKIGEMKDVGTACDGRKIFQMESRNFIGQEVPKDIIFALNRTERTGQNSYFGRYIFDIYLKHGVPIPDVVKNCKPTGGELKIVVDDATQFPPTAFNTDEIIGLTIQINAPAYVYSGVETTLDSVKALPGVQLNIGSLKFNDKTYPLNFHLNTIYLIDGQNAYEYYPNASRVDMSKLSRDSLQLKQILFASVPSISWYTPNCKPAVYLYPQKETDVNVKVNTSGNFSYTNPVLPENGWNAKADPTGELTVNGINYPYLYYETKIPNSKVNVPKEGFVVEYSKLPELYDNLLPKLGLSQKEISDFKNYWEKALPPSKYYFVGIIQQGEIDKLEQLLINPTPDSLIRVRVYFEALDTKINVFEPKITTPVRSGFTAVEWGGMVKPKEGSTFTCSQ